VVEQEPRKEPRPLIRAIIAKKSCVPLSARSSRKRAASPYPRVEKSCVPLSAPGGANGILFTGADGKIEVNRGYLRSWPDEIIRTPLGPGDVHLYRSIGHHQDWLDAIRARSRPICDVEIGRGSINVCHLGNLAYWLNRPLKWDPAKREFIGDAEATRWLDRPRRAVWRL